MSSHPWVMESVIQVCSFIYYLLICTRITTNDVSVLILCSDGSRAGGWTGKRRGDPKGHPAALPQLTEGSCLPITVWMAKSMPSEQRPSSPEPVSVQPVTFCPFGES